MSKRISPKSWMRALCPPLSATGLRLPTWRWNAQGQFTLQCSSHPLQNASSLYPFAALICTTHHVPVLSTKCAISRQDLLLPSILIPLCKHMLRNLGHTARLNALPIADLFLVTQRKVRVTRVPSFSIPHLKSHFHVDIRILTYLSDILLANECNTATKSLLKHSQIPDRHLYQVPNPKTDRLFFPLSHVTSPSSSSPASS